MSNYEAAKEAFLNSPAYKTLTYFGDAQRIPRMQRQAAEDRAMHYFQSDPNKQGLVETSYDLVPGSRAATSFAPKGLDKDGWLKNADTFLKNEDGSPKVLYHGTNANIEGFRHGNTARAGAKYQNQGNIFLTSDPKFASEYAEGLGGNVIPVNLNAEKLFDYSATRTPGKVTLGPRGLTKSVTDELKAQGYTGTRGFRYPHEVTVFDPASIKSAFHKNRGYDSTADLLSTKIDMADFYDNWWKK